MGNSLILASASKRRQELLARIGIPFRVVVADSREVWPGEQSIEEAVATVALEKVRWVEEQYPDAWILAADTVVVLGESILQKPRDRQDAVHMLQRLSGRSHEVFTGYCLRNRALGRTLTGAERTIVVMRNLSLSEIEGYVRAGEPMDKAGAYGIQGVGAMFISRIYGSYTNVVGLPLAEVVALMMREGIISPMGRQR